MNKQQSLLPQKDIDTQNKPLLDLIDPYIKKWYVYVILILISLFSVAIYLRYSIPTFKSQATILIKQDDKEQGTNGINVLENLEMLQSSSNLMNEIEVMKAHSVLGPLVDSLNLRLTGYLIGDNSGFRKLDLYSDLPIEVIVNPKFQNQELSVDEFSFSTKLKILSANRFSLEENEKIYFFGENISLFDPKFLVRFKLKSRFLNQWIGKTIELKYISKEAAIFSVSGKIVIEKKEKEATVLTISTEGQNIKRNNDILTELIESYKTDALNDKNKVAANTSAFIVERMNFLLEELNDVEKSGEKYKVQNKIIDFDADLAESLTGKNEASRSLDEAEIELKLIDYLADYLKNNDYSLLLPANLGFKDANINEMTNQYNKLVLDRSKFLQSSNSSNPLVRKTETQLLALKESLDKGLRNLSNSVSLRLKSYNKKFSIYNSELSEMPSFQRGYRAILRQQQIKESLYLYLLQKREENEIELAASVSNIKIIQPAHDSGQQISPNPILLYLIAFLVGLVIPIAIIYISQILDNKVKSLEDLSGFNVIGQIPKSDDIKKIISPDDRTYLSEAFRMLRANINFFLSGSERKSHLIAISSTLPNEGKTFTTVNLAHSLCNIGNKVIIVGLDLRVPKLSDYFVIDNKTGISNFVVDLSMKPEEIIQRYPENENLFFINAGDIPPNPSELLMRDRFNDLLEYLRQHFTYIILDTSPIGLIADCLPVVQKADLLLYVVRCGFLDRKLLHIPRDYMNDGVILNCAVVLNYIDPLEKRYGYAYRYGYHYRYGYTNDYFSRKSSQSFWTKWFVRKRDL
jgi:tyrosine-protein kinase Etk/Wzc